MERKSVDSHGASTMSFKTALATMDTPNKTTTKRQSIFAGMSLFTPKKATATSGLSDVDKTPKASTKHCHDLDETPKASTQQHRASRAFQVPQELQGESSRAQHEQQNRVSRVYQVSQERQAESSQAQYDQQRYEPVTDKPVPIPDAVPKIRLPVQCNNGLLVMTESRAPVPFEQVNLLKKIDDEDRKVKEEYRRLKQGMMKWRATNSPSEQVKDDKDVKRRSRVWARKSISMVKDILNPGRDKDDMTELVPAGDPVGPQEDMRTGNAIMLGEHVNQPFAGQYPHTITAVADEEGQWKTEAYMRGYHNGYQTARSEQEYKQGYQDGLKAFGSAPPQAAPVEHRAPEEELARGRLVRRDGSLVPQHEVVCEVAQMMENLEIRRADGSDDPEDVKGKKKQEPRLPWEIREFVKDVEYELRSYSCM
ncbi:hypothetical protein HD806DRAFT_552352 [Xylariaceae sp. AK1471]|nr:hypothetical protein HD806DRAFT_552352 [Xylariaceae sp. AK1471]